MSLWRLPWRAWMPAGLGGGYNAAKSEAGLIGWLGEHATSGAARLFLLLRDRPWVREALCRHARFPLDVAWQRRLRTREAQIPLLAAAPTLTSEAGAELAAELLCLLEREAAGLDLVTGPLSVRDVARVAHTLQQRGEAFFPSPVLEDWVNRLAEVWAMSAEEVEAEQALFAEMAERVLFTSLRLQASQLEGLAETARSEPERLALVLSMPGVPKETVLAALGEHPGSSVVAEAVVVHPERLREREVRVALRPYDSPRILSARVDYEEGEERRVAFRQLMLRWPERAVEMLEEDRKGIRALLVAPDLLPLLQAPEATIRLRAVAVAHHFGGASSPTALSAEKTPLPFSPGRSR